jgi:hypothetical protein
LVWFSSISSISFSHFRGWSGNWIISLQAYLFLEELELFSVCGLQHDCLIAEVCFSFWIESHYSLCRNDEITFATITLVVEHSMSNEENLWAYWWLSHRDSNTARSIIHSHAVDIAGPVLCWFTFTDVIKFILLVFSTQFFLWICLEDNHCSFCLLNKFWFHDLVLQWSSRFAHKLSVSESVIEPGLFSKRIKYWGNHQLSNRLSYWPLLISVVSPGFVLHYVTTVVRTARLLECQLILNIWIRTIRVCAFDFGQTNSIFSNIQSEGIIQSRLTSIDEYEN